MMFRPVCRLLPVSLAVIGAVALSGCTDSGNSPAESSSTPKRTVPVRVLIVDDPGLARAIERQWNARADTEAKITEITSREISELDSPRVGADVIIYPSGLLGDLVVQDLIAPLERDQLNDPRLARGDLFSLQQTGEVTWGNQIYAVPFGSPQLTLLYRSDLFDQLGLSPPETWGEYDEVAKRLSERQSVAGSITLGDSWQAVAEPLGPGWAGKVLLARAAAYAKHRSQFSTIFDARTMEPLIAGPPFIRALNELVAAAALGSDNGTSQGPADTRGEFSAGRCAMALSWPSGTKDESADSIDPIGTGFAELPGSEVVYNFRTDAWESRLSGESSHVTLAGVAGRLGSITRECRRIGVGLNTLFFLCGTEFGQDISGESESTTLYRESHLRTASAWVSPGLGAQSAQQYAEAVQSAQSRSTWFSCVRIPGQQEYLAALDKAVHEAIAGTATVEQALETAAESWRGITQRRGHDQQQHAYMRSIGREP